MKLFSLAALFSGFLLALKRSHRHAMPVHEPAIAPAGLGSPGTETDVRYAIDDLLTGLD